MNRSQMMSILNNVEDSKLVSALSAIGVETGHENMDLGEESDADGLEGWSARDVTVPSIKKEPLVDVSKFTKAAEMADKKPMGRWDQILGKDAGDDEEITPYMPQEETANGAY